MFSSWLSWDKLNKNATCGVHENMRIFLCGLHMCFPNITCSWEYLRKKGVLQDGKIS